MRKQQSSQRRTEMDAPLYRITLCILSVADYKHIAEATLIDDGYRGVIA